MNRTTKVMAVGSALLALTVAACGGNSDATGEGASSGKADAAKAKEQAGKFRTISMPDDWNNYGAFWDGVCKTNNLGCVGTAGKNREDASDASSAEVIQFFKDDKQNPAVCGDIGIAFTGPADANGVGIDYLPEQAKALPQKYRSKTGGWEADVTGVISILVNKDKVPNPPKSFADLKKPEYKGKIFMKNPEESGTGQATVFAVAAALGEGKDGFDLDGALKFFKELQDAGQFAKAKFSDEAFERGETPIALGYDYVYLATAKEMKAKGVHAEVSIPTDGGVWAPSALVCNKNTTAPDLAKLAMDYALSDEGQKLFAQVGAHPIRAVTGDLQLSDADKANWLPEAQYAAVKEFPGDTWPDAGELAQRWKDEVKN
jgi:putative spermidine/putrescine transport system substrate-binding protein